MEKDKKTAIQFTVLTFCIAFLMSGILIFLGQFGFSVKSSVQDSLCHLGMSIPFAIYILSPAIASAIVLIRNKEVAGFKEWLKTVFHFKNSILSYFFVFTGLACYFLIHVAVSGPSQTMQPFYMFFLSLPGNLIIGGMEETGWAYVLHPRAEKKYGFILSSVFVGIIWLFWHVPLFFIPGTNHAAGVIDFWMFAVQIVAFRFLYGAISKISGKGHVFMCVLCHTMFNAASYAFGIPPATWPGTIAANIGIILVSITIVKQYHKKNDSVI